MCSPERLSAILCLSVAASVGARARIKIPAALAYGERGFPGLVPPNSGVEFDLELVELI